MAALVAFFSAFCAALFSDGLPVILKTIQDNGFAPLPQKIVETTSDPAVDAEVNRENQASIAAGINAAAD